jgi:peptidoglycan-associated lipoprotein
MKIKKLVQAMIVTCGIIGLVACSSFGKKNDAAVSDANAAGGAQTMGAGDNNSFGSDGNESPEQLLAKRTYYFEFDKSEVREQDKPAISANADNLVAHPSAKILLEGHTDPRGSREYNVALGEHRANAVADMLKAKGVNPDQIRVISYGAERLAVPGHTEQDFQQDRRVVLVYLQQ